MLMQTSAASVLAFAAQHNSSVASVLGQLRVRAAQASEPPPAPAAGAALRAPAPAGAVPGGSPPMAAPSPAAMPSFAPELQAAPRSSRTLVWVAMAAVGLLVLLALTAVLTLGGEPVPASSGFTGTPPPPPPPQGVQVGTILPLVVAFLVGGVLVALATRAGRQPLSNVTAPDVASDEPLRELHALTARMRARLTTTFRMQVAFVVAVAVLLVAILGWSAMLVSSGQVGFGAVFGAGGIGLTLLSQWKWQPFDRIALARNEANAADAAAFAIQGRIAMLQEIADPAARARAQWEAISEYLQLVQPAPTG